MPDITQEYIQDRLGRFLEICRQKGMKVTHQRLEIFRELVSTGEHPTAEDLFIRVRPRMPTVSLDTVYRTLATLQEYGVVARVEVLDDRGRYDANLKPHHHFVCVKCKKVEDLYWPAIDGIQPPAEAESLGIIHQLHAELRGICRKCMDELPGKDVEPK